MTLFSRAGSLFGFNGPFTPDSAGAPQDLPAQPDPVDTIPRVGKLPLGGSGRAHWSGFIQPDEMNPELVGVQGILTYDDMYFSDPYMRRMILMLASTIQGGTVGVEPFGGDAATQLDKDIVDKVWWWLSEYMHPNIYEHLAEMLPVTFRNGFCPFEQIWQVCRENPFGETLTLPYKLALRLPRSIFQWPQDQLEDLAGIVQILPTAAAAFIPASELVYYRTQAEGDNWQGRSLLRQAFKSFFYKSRLESIEAIGLERKAVGLPVVYPPQNAKPQTKTALEAVIANAHTGESAYIVMPGPWWEADKDNGWFLDIVKFDSSAGGEINDAIERHQDGIAASVLGDFMSLGHHQVGARATAEVQEDPFLTVVTSLIETVVLAPINRLIQRVVKANWPAAKGAPKLQIAVADTASLSEIATFIQLLVSVNALQVDPEMEDWLRERAQMPVANGILRRFGFEAQVERLKAQVVGAQQAQQPPEPGQVEGTQEQADGQSGNDQPANFNGKPPAKTLDDGQVDPKWFEKLLAKDQLGDALKGAKQRLLDATQGPVSTAATMIAVQAQNGQSAKPEPTPELVAAFESAFTQLYHVGYDTAAHELSRQHAHLKTGGRVTLMSPSDVAKGAGARLARAKERAHIAARAVVQAVVNATDRARSGGASTLDGLQTVAQRAATGQLQVEANANAMDLINAGRFDLADSNATAITQATYTSCLDNNTCDDCSAEDGTVFTDMDEAEQAVPNALCAGGPERCRCTVVFQLSDDPRAYTDFG